MSRPMTPRGYSLLREELRRLKALRPQNAKAIEAARAHGDLSENADYDAAKNKSGLTEARIRDVESALANAQVIDPSLIETPHKVVFGTSVKIADLESGEERTVSIYGSEESDVSKGWISFESPMGHALIGKAPGDTVTVKLPAGSREYEILEVFVEYAWSESDTPVDRAEGSSL